MAYKKTDDASNIPKRARVVVRHVVEEIETDETEAIAEQSAKERGTILGAKQFPETGKKPSNKRPMKKISYGRGKNLKIDTTSKDWKEYREGKITFDEFKSRACLTEGRRSSEKPQWMKDIESGKRKQKKAEPRQPPRPILLY